MLVEELTNKIKEPSMRAQCALAIAAVAISAFASTTADAQRSPRRAVSGRPLVIQKPQRSFLDPGPVVPVDSLRNYVTQSTSLYVPPYHAMGPSGFGWETLPHRFDVPGLPPSAWAR
jgi:hypothetical protein